MTTFNIGSQNAASIQNVAGDSVVHGGLHAAASWETVELRLVVDEVRKEAAVYGEAVADEALAAAAAEAGRPQPEKARVADHLGTAVHSLQEAGALVDAGSSLVASLRRAGRVLGPAGAAVLALL
jgi:hypothetical protein